MTEDERKRAVVNSDIGGLVSRLPVAVYQELITRVVAMTDAAEQRGAEREREALREIINKLYQPDNDGGDDYCGGWDTALDHVDAAIRARSES